MSNISKIKIIQPNNDPQIYDIKDTAGRKLLSWLIEYFTGQDPSSILENENTTTQESSTSSDILQEIFSNLQELRALDTSVEDEDEKSAVRGIESLVPKWMICTIDSNSGGDI